MVLVPFLDGGREIIIRDAGSMSEEVAGAEVSEVIVCITECGKDNRIVMTVVFFCNTGALVVGSNAVRILKSFSSGKKRPTSSSREKRPRSTHCIAATVVMSFVHDATQKTASVRNGAAPSSREAVPNAFS